MRRIALSLVLASTATLAACSGGGSVLNFGGSNTAKYVSIQPYFAGQGGGPSQTIASFIVAQPSYPTFANKTSITLKATGLSDQNAGLVNTTYRWTAALTNTGTFTQNAVNQQAACPKTINVYAAPLSTTPVPPATVPVLPAPVSTVNIGTTDLTNNIAVQPEDSSVATFNVPAYAAIAPTPATLSYAYAANGAPPAIGGATESAPSYCVVITAIAANGASGSVTLLAQAI